MGKAFVCDMTKKTVKGEAVKNFKVDISDTFKLQITPLEVDVEGRDVNGEICDAAVEQIRSALSCLSVKKEKVAAKKKGVANKK